MKNKILAFLLTFLISSSVFAGSIKVSWDANIEPDLAGYKLYYREDAGLTQTMIDVGNVVEYEITGLTTGVFYNIRATAYDTSGNESGQSYAVGEVAVMPKVKRLTIIKN